MSAPDSVPDFMAKAHRGAFRHAEGHVVVPMGVKSIPANTFRGSNITSVSIPSSVVRIGSSAFQKSSLTRVSTAVHSVGDHAFDDCFALVEVEMPSVETIGDYVFCHCKKLAAMRAPAGPLV